MELVGFLVFLAIGWLVWRGWAKGSSTPSASRPSATGVQKFSASEDVKPGPAWRKMNAFHQSLVGEQHYTTSHDSFLRGSECRLEILREPDNPHDENALAVMGLWRDKAGERREKLGYLPRQFSAEVAATRPRDLEMRAVAISTYTSRRDGYRNMKVDVYEPSVSSGYWRGLGIPAPSKVSAS